MKLSEWINITLAYVVTVAVVNLVIHLIGYNRPAMAGQESMCGADPAQTVDRRAYCDTEPDGGPCVPVDIQMDEPSCRNNWRDRDILFVAPPANIRSLPQHYACQEPEIVLSFQFSATALRSTRLIH